MMLKEELLAANAARGIASLPGRRCRDYDGKAWVVCLRVQ